MAWRCGLGHAAPLDISDSDILIYAELKLFIIVLMLPKLQYKENDLGEMSIRTNLSELFITST